MLSEGPDKGLEHMQIRDKKRPLSCQKGGKKEEKRKSKAGERRSTRVVNNGPSKCAGIALALLLFL